MTPTAIHASPDLRAIGAGFGDAALGSQAVFRAALTALSHPGRVVALDHDAQVPRRGHAAAAALLLALLDADCTLWLSPSLAGTDAATWLRFHTGCALVEDRAHAQFAWVAAGDALPALDGFAQGSDAYPDQSATCVLDMPLLSEGSGWTLRGPGIDGQAHLQCGGLPPQTLRALAAQCNARRESFPRGVDLFLASPTHIAALPRTTRIDMTEA